MITLCSFMQIIICTSCQKIFLRQKPVPFWHNMKRNLFLKYLVQLKKLQMEYLSMCGQSLRFIMTTTRRVTNESFICENERFENDV